MDKKKRFTIDPGWKNVISKKQAVYLSWFQRLLCSWFDICVAELWSVGVMHSSDVAAACCKIYPGAYAWRLRNIRRIEAVLLKGKLRLFDIPADIEIKYL